jgi:hypothetical protein
MSSKSFRVLSVVVAVSVLTLACVVSGAPTVPPVPTAGPQPTVELGPTAGAGAVASPLPVASQPVAGQTPQPGGGTGQLTVDIGSVRIENGYLKVAGRVRNGSQQVLSGATISLAFYDKANTPMTFADTLGGYSQKVEMTSGPVAPGEYGYFMFLRDMGGQTPTIDHQEGSAVGRWETNIGTLQTSGVKAGSLSADPISVTGTAKNAGSVDCRSPDVIIVGLAKDGTVYVVEGTPLEDSAGNLLAVLKAGDSVNFSAFLSNGNAKVAQVVAASHCSPN